MKKTTIATLVLASLLSSTSALAYEKGDWVFRAGVTQVSPDDSSSDILAGGDSLGIGGVAVDSNAQLGINIAYFFTERWNIEVLAATPFSHDVNFAQPDPLGTGNKLAEVTHLPPTITANYYFNDPKSAWQPYAGVGVNYTIFFDEEFTGANKDAGLSDLDLDNSFGLSAQVGVDYMLNDKWHVNGSVRWIDIDTSAEFAVGGDPIGSIKDITIDPWVYTLSIGYKF